MLSLPVATVSQVTAVALTRSCPSDTQVLFHGVSALTRKLFPIVEAMQKHFSSGSGAYYSDAIFFLSVAMHRIIPDSKELPLCHLAQINKFTFEQWLIGSVRLCESPLEMKD